MNKNSIFPVFFLLLTVSCTTLFNETKISTQSENIDTLTSFSLGEVNIVDKNNLSVSSYQVKNYINIISSHTLFPIDNDTKNGLILNIDIKENSYLKSLETENSIVTNLTLIDTSDDKILYHGLLIKSSKEPLTSDSLLFSIINKSYKLLENTLVSYNKKHLKELELLAKETNE